MSARKATPKQDERLRARLERMHGKVMDGPEGMQHGGYMDCGCSLARRIRGLGITQECRLVPVTLLRARHGCHKYGCEDEAVAMLRVGGGRGEDQARLNVVALCRGDLAQVVEQAKALLKARRT